MSARGPRPRIRVPWTDEDRNRASSLFREGISNDEIASALGRKPKAVRAWIYNYLRTPRIPVHIEYPTTMIERHQIEQFYLLGWRFIGTTGDLHICEWRSLREPRFPEVRAAA